MSISQPLTKCGSTKKAPTGMLGDLLACILATGQFHYPPLCGLPTQVLRLILWSLFCIHQSCPKPFPQ